VNTIQELIKKSYEVGLKEEVAREEVMHKEDIKT
jgi:hypothetical protein